MNLAAGMHFHGLFELSDLVLQGVDVLAHCLRVANAHVSPGSRRPGCSCGLCGQALTQSP